jgi:hypothetical protein
LADSSLCSSLCFSSLQPPFKIYSCRWPAISLHTHVAPVKQRAEQQPHEFCSVVHGLQHMSHTLHLVISLLHGVTQVQRADALARGLRALLFGTQPYRHIAGVHDWLGSGDGSWGRGARNGDSTAVACDRASRQKGTLITSLRQRE